MRSQSIHGRFAAYGRTTDRPLRARPRAQRALLTTLSLSVASCTIILEPGGPEPVPVPVPVPLQCDPTGATRTAHLLFDVRVERTTVNLAPHHARLMELTASALVAARVMPTQAVLIRADERPVDAPVLAAWGCDLDDPRELSAQAVLEHYATHADLPDSPIGCATDPLTQAGARLRELVTQYPPELPGRSGLRMFGAAPDLVLVVHLDERRRRSGLEDPACDGARALAGDERGRAWLAYDGGIGSGQVVHWFLTTEEGISREVFVESCRSREGFPADTLDLMDPSEEALYGPLARLISEGGAARVATLPLCAALVEREAAAFLDVEIRAIAELAGTTVDETALGSVLTGGGLPELGPGGEGR